MNREGVRTARLRRRVPLAGCAAAAAALAFTGCANQYRPVVAAINPVGPAAQPTKYAIAVSDPNELNASGSLSGLLSIVDVFGDTILATPSIIPHPTYYAQQAGGGYGYVVNAQNSLAAIPISAPQSLISSQVINTTLPAGANPPSLSAFTLGTTARILVPEPGASGGVSILTATSPALQQQLSGLPNPVYVVGNDNTSRAYVLNNTNHGQVSAIEASTLSISATVPVGANPVYGVESADNRRVFVLNQGDGTVSVINVINNAIDNAVPTIQLDPTGTLGLQPVWADLATNTNQLIVVSKRANDAAGYLSIINIPLCNAVAQPTNPSCDPANPVDGVGFGQVLATVPVGVNPVQVAVLVDGTQAFVANQGDRFAVPEVEGSMTVVNVVSGQVTATIPGATAYNAGVPNPIAAPTCAVTAVATGATQACVYGHPNTIAATTGTPTGKVYLTAPDSNFLTVLETDTDTVSTHINLQGTGVRVQVSAR